MKGVEAMEAVSEAMRVIVDFMVGEDTEPMERVSSKYAKVRAVDERVCGCLEALSRESPAYVRWVRLACGIRGWAERNPSFLMCPNPRPERWMFERAVV